MQMDFPWMILGQKEHINVFEMQPCAMCKGGYLLNPSSGKITLCDFCMGYGEVDPTKICACGRAAIKRIESYATCGRDECLRDFKFRHSYTDYTTNFGPNHWNYGSDYSD